ncbi:MAG: hypothetical protein NZ870_02920 [bacterium]|nr:hypothetical protein [bacterium]
MIIEVNTSKEIDNFVKLPLKIYENSKYYVSPLLKQIKAFFSPNHPYRKHADIVFFFSI